MHLNGAHSYCILLSQNKQKQKTEKMKNLASMQGNNNDQMTHQQQPPPPPDVNGLNHNFCVCTMILNSFIFQGILVVDIETTKVTPILCSKSSVVQFMNIHEIVTASDISCFHHVNTCYMYNLLVLIIMTH